MSGQAQHYIPQFYLRNFAKKRRGRHFLACYHKPDRRCFVSNIVNLAQETSFYDIPEDPTEGAAAETFLRTAETKWARAIDTVLKRP